MDVDRDLLIDHRWGDADDGRLERFLVVITFSADNQFVEVPSPASGDRDDILNGGTARVDDYGLRNERIDSHRGKIFRKS